MAKPYTWRNLRRCLANAGAVATILVTINQGWAAFFRPPRDLVVFGRMGLKYVVLFSVASVSALMSGFALLGVKSAFDARACDRATAASPPSQRGARETYLARL